MGVLCCSTPATTISISSRSRCPASPTTLPSTSIARSGRLTACCYTSSSAYVAIPSALQQRYSQNQRLHQRGNNSPLLPLRRTSAQRPLRAGRRRPLSYRERSSTQLRTRHRRILLYVREADRCQADAIDDAVQRRHSLLVALVPRSPRRDQRRAVVIEFNEQIVRLLHSYAIPTIVLTEILLKKPSPQCSTINYSDLRLDNSSCSTRSSPGTRVLRGTRITSESARTERLQALYCASIDPSTSQSHKLSPNRAPARHSLSPARRHLPEQNQASRCQRSRDYTFKLTLFSISPERLGPRGLAVSI